jgi:hypothetical protein
MQDSRTNKNKLQKRTYTPYELLIETYPGSNIMMRALILSLAFLSGPALAGAPHYQAEPAVKPAAAKLVLRDTVWTCGDSGCVAGRSNSRPQIVCAVLARKVGTLRSFSSEGAAMGAEELEKCNSRAN